MKEETRKQREEERERKEEREAKEAERQERELERERLKAQKEYDKEIRKNYLLIAKDQILAGATRSRKYILKLALLLLILVLIGLGLTFQQALVRNGNAVLAGIILLLGILILHRMRRRRMARGRWKLALANKMLYLPTKWGKGLHELSFTLNTVVERLKVTVKRSRPTTPAPERVYQGFVIAPNVEGDVVSDARLKFRVKKSWMLRNRVSPSTVKLMRLDHDRWQGIGTDVVSTDPKYVYYVAEADSFGEFAIVGKPNKQVVVKRPIGRWLAWTLFGVIILVALIALSLLSPSTGPTVGIPAQIWKQDTQHTIDLGEYFKDPDNDQLAFTVTRTDNIDIQFIDDKAVLVPHYGWSGRERAVFIADDGKGGVVKSNPVELVVEPNLIPNTWKRYAKPVLTAAIILIVLLGAILFRKRIKKIIGLEA